jgi:hypothetical protein
VGLSFQIIRIFEDDQQEEEESKVVNEYGEDMDIDDVKIEDLMNNIQEGVGEEKTA